MKSFITYIEVYAVFDFPYEVQNVISRIRKKIWSDHKLLLILHTINSKLMSAGRTVNSQSQTWGTPKKYVDAVRRFFCGSIALDPCSNEYSIVNADVEYSLPKKDGLKESWDFPTIYVNPPYGSDRERGTTIKNWLAKCAISHKKYQSEIIALVPVATNTGHWKQSVFGEATAICFLYDTRLRFLENGLDVGKGAPMACSMIYWGRNYQAFYDEFIKYGAVVEITSLHNESIEKDRTILKLQLG